MFLIFGYGRNKPVVHTLRGEERCGHCNNKVNMNLVKVSHAVNLFFIPVLPVKTEYGKICPVCSRGMAMTRDEYENLINQTW